MSRKQHLNFLNERLNDLNLLSEIYMQYLNYTNSISSKNTEKQEVKQEPVSPGVAAANNVSIETEESPQLQRKQGHPTIDEFNVAHGKFYKKFLKLKLEDAEGLMKQTRMTGDVFDKLLRHCKHKLSKEEYNGSWVLPEVRLFITLSFLSQGMEIELLAHSCGLETEAVWAIICDTSEVIWRQLNERYVHEPNCSESRRIINDLQRLSGLPNCLGAIDGRYTAIEQSAAAEGKLDENGLLLLLGACDTKYKFTYVEVIECDSDATNDFQCTTFSKRLLEEAIDTPPTRNLRNGAATEVQHYFLGNNAFPLHPRMMKAFPGQLLPSSKRHFNACVAKARSTIDNAFGILADRWRVLWASPLQLQPEQAAKIMLSCVALHNFLLKYARSVYVPPLYSDWENEQGELQEGLWRQEVADNYMPLRSVQQALVYRKAESTRIRNLLCEQVNNKKRS